MRKGLPVLGLMLRMLGKYLVDNNYHLFIFFLENRV